MTENSDRLKEIQKLVDVFMESLTPRFSSVWKEDLVSRVTLSRKGQPVDLDAIEVVHADKLLRLYRSCIALLSRQYDLDHERLSNIVSGAYVKWHETFDPEKATQSKDPELFYLVFLANRVAITQFNREHPKSKEPTSQDHSDGRGARITFIDIDEAPWIVDNKAQEAIESAAFDQSQYEDSGLGDESQLVSFKVIAKTGGFEKRVAFVAAKEIFRYYSLTKRVHITTSRRNLPPLIGKFKHNAASFIHFHRDVQKLNLDLTLLNTGDVTGYYKMRHHVLSHAGNRRWMELAIAKLKESKAKKQRTLANAGLDTQTIGDVVGRPLLGAVAVHTDGTISTCFRGEAHNSTLPEDHRDHWKKHCEYSLFVDVIGKKNPGLLRDSTLFVTLEPCNAREYIHDTEPKIPCAVRCVEAELKRVFIGSFDYNKSISGSGIQILETGIYEFHFENGAYKSKSREGAEGLAQLEEYFKKNNYELLSNSNEHCRKYRIGKPIEVGFFDADLMFEIYDLNAQFQQKKNPDSYEFGFY